MKQGAIYSALSSKRFARAIPLSHTKFVFSKPTTGKLIFLNIGIIIHLFDFFRLEN
jgi:hypothetical protein